MTATVTALLDAGRTLAAISEPLDDGEFAYALRELALTLRQTGDGLDRAIERAEVEYDRRFDKMPLYTFSGQPITLDELRLDRDNAIKRARSTTLRTAQKALIDLCALLTAMDGEG